MKLAAEIAFVLGNSAEVSYGWLCNCPCCNDTEASLTVVETSLGDAVFECAKGCTFKAISDAVVALGLPLSVPRTEPPAGAPAEQPPLPDPPLLHPDDPGPTPPPPPAKKTKGSAPREDYYELFESILGNPRRCIFARKLLYQERETGIWNPAINALDLIKSEALFRNAKRKTKFAMSEIAPHFASFEQTKSPELLVDIPEWDGEDRITAMAGLIQLRASNEISDLALSELLKEWCAKMFQRLHNPMIQNRILVLQGGQGIGKDTWISMLVDGLGQFAVPLAVMRDDKDTYLTLHQGLVMKISEFDKTSRTEVSTLKDIITAPTTTLRAPYEHDAKMRFLRCSFISSANAESLLRDSTGNRRFLIFEVDKIEFAYAGWSYEKIKHWQLQCLAEMKYLADCNYRAADSSWREMNEYIEKETPSDALDDMSESFCHQLQKRIDLMGVPEIAFSDPRLDDLILELSRQTGIKPRGVKMMLRKRIGAYKRIGNKRFWVLRADRMSLNGSAPEPGQLPLESQESSDNF